MQITVHFRINVFTLKHTKKTQYHVSWLSVVLEELLGFEDLSSRSRQHEASDDRLLLAGSVDRMGPRFSERLLRGPPSQCFGVCVCASVRCMISVGLHALIVIVQIAAAQKVGEVFAPPWRRLF